MLTPIPIILTGNRLTSHAACNIYNGEPEIRYKVYLKSNFKKVILYRYQDKIYCKWIDLLIFAKHFENGYALSCFANNKKFSTPKR